MKYGKFCSGLSEMGCEKGRNPSLRLRNPGDCVIKMYRDWRNHDGNTCKMCIRDRIMDDSLFRAFFDLGYQLTGGVGEGYRELNLEFRNGKANVMIFYYHNIGFLYPYAVFCVLLSGMLFLIVILYFISRKMKQVSQIETSILQIDVYKRQAAAIISDLLAKEVDFFSIGTNDLTQYTLAIDRQNAKLDEFYDPHHEAVLRMIEMVVDNAHKAGILSLIHI